MKRIVPLILLMLVALPTHATARALIADLSPRVVDISHDFTGLDVLLYGVQNDPGAVAVVLRGPAKDVTLRKKERIAGIWVNTESVTFKDVPQLYITAESEPLQAINNEELLRALGVGLEYMQLTPEDPNEKKEVLEDFQQAYFRIMQHRSLYNEKPVPLSFWGETLFRSYLHFPKNLTAGWYTADVYLFTDGLLSHVQSFPIHVRKIGFEAWVYGLAQRHSVLYGIACVALAVSAGWTATRFFKRV